MFVFSFFVRYVQYTEWRRKSVTARKVTTQKKPLVCHFIITSQTASTWRHNHV